MTRQLSRLTRRPRSSLKTPQESNELQSSLINTKRLMAIAVRGALRLAATLLLHIYDQHSPRTPTGERARRPASKPPPRRPLTGMTPAAVLRPARKNPRINTFKFVIIPSLDSRGDRDKRWREPATPSQPATPRAKAVPAAHLPRPRRPPSNRGVGGAGGRGDNAGGRREGR